MDLQLAGKRALVTGASGAIGEAIAIGLAAEQATVVVQGRRKDALDRVVEAITAGGGRATAADAITGANYRIDGGSTTSIN